MTDGRIKDERLKDDPARDKTAVGAGLRLEDLSKVYGAKGGAVRAVDAVSLELAPGETLALLGPSGCGKSTLLRLIAGLEAPSGGRVVLGGRDLSALPPEKRGFGLVFQDYALFPHLSVEHNVAYGLVEKGWPKAARLERVGALLALVGLEGYAGRRTFELSGGEQQRVALARALAAKPALLLLDEPLSNLDLALRETLKGELGALLAGLAIAAVYVTHDQSEAFALADRVAVMRAGRVLRLAPAAELYAEPGTPWVARFLGHRNVFASSALGALAAPGAPMTLLRDDLIRLGEGALQAEVIACARNGPLLELELALLEPHVALTWSGFAREFAHLPAPGERHALHVPPQAIVALREDTPR